MGWDGFLSFWGKCQLMTGHAFQGSTTLPFNPNVLPFFHCPNFFPLLFSWKTLSFSLCGALRSSGSSSDLTPATLSKISLRSLNQIVSSPFFFLSLHIFFFAWWMERSKWGFSFPVSLFSGVVGSGVALGFLGGVFWVVISHEIWLIYMHFGEILLELCCISCLITLKWMFFVQFIELHDLCI